MSGSSLQSSLVVPNQLSGDWTAAVVCTFGADLAFFEARLLSQLSRVPLRTVLADSAQLAERMGEAARSGQRLRLANRTYVAAPIRHGRAAHGKLIMLLGPSEGRLLVGSGNLGYDGYASPGELWSVFAYADERPEHVDEFAAARAIVDGLATRELIDPPVKEALEASWELSSWLPSAPGLAATPAVRSNLDRPLIDQLAEAATEPVAELVAHAPFHDPECAALSALIERFAPAKVRLLVTTKTSAHAASIQRVIEGRGRASVELVTVRGEPSAYIHAKWVHLIHRDSETLLSGSANLSRVALLHAADRGNIEFGVISTGARGAFSAIYTHLDSEKVADLRGLPVTLSETPAEEPASSDGGPVVLWSRIEGSILTLTFDRNLPEGTAIALADHAGRAIVYDSLSLDGVTARATISRDSREVLADGAPISVLVSDSTAEPSVTWPYQVGRILGRRDKEASRPHLFRLDSPPEGDAELYALLEQLEQALIVDRASLWRIAKPGAIPEPEDADSTSLGLGDLDWARVRRDPRYTGYFARSGEGGLPVTDIQVMLAAIAGRLGDFNLAPEESALDESDDLAGEGDVGLSAEVEGGEEELGDEVSRRQLSITTRTKMAFDRFARRFTTALNDQTFVDELGPIPAATNAIILDHVLEKLLQVGAVGAPRAIEARVAAWRLLWGDADTGGIEEGLDDDSRAIIDGRIAEVSARARALRGVVSSLDLEIAEDARAQVRDAARHMFVDEGFGLSVDLLVTASPRKEHALEFLESLEEVAFPAPDDRLLDFIAQPFGMDPAVLEWREKAVHRVGAARGDDIRVETLVVGAPVENLTSEVARAWLERTAAATLFLKRDNSYFRVRFAGNGTDVAFWDDDAKFGVASIAGVAERFESFEVQWPEWTRRCFALVSELESDALRSESAA